MSIAERIQRILRAEWNDRIGREARPPESATAALRDGEREVLHGRELLSGLRREREDALDEVRRCEEAAAGALRAHDDERARTWLRMMRDAESRAASIAERIDQEYRRMEPLERSVTELRARVSGVPPVTVTADSTRNGVPASPLASTPGPAIGEVRRGPVYTPPITHLQGVEHAVSAIDDTFGRMESRIASAEAGLLLDAPPTGDSAVEQRFAALESQARLDAFKSRASDAPGVPDEDALARLRRRMGNP